MNPFLAELYDTAENIGAGAPTVDDTEKLAQAAVLDQMLKNEGFTVEQLSPQDIVKVATEIFGPDSPLVKEAMEGEMPPAFLAGKKDEKEEKKDEKKDKEEKEKEAQVKMDESDFLGRAMAHAYVDELRTIEKKAQAEAQTPQPRAAPAGVPSTLASLLNKEASAQPEQPQGAQSAVDILARQRAEEMLKAAGIQTETQSNLDTAVQARANEMLKEAGYTVE